STNFVGYITISFASSASEAQNKNSNIVNALILSISGSSYAKEITTIGYFIYPEYDYSFTPPTLTGYKAVTNLRIRTNKINAVGTLLDLLVENGATEINSISFSLSEKKAAQAREQALKDAVNNANSKAEQLAKEAKIILGKPVHVAESYSMPYLSTMRYAAGTTILPEEIKVSAAVSISYEII
ncbi:MAG: SIMPL domain-containing protein, partial [Candidatus Nanoarchaeia archaeon]